MCRGLARLCRGSASLGETCSSSITFLIYAPASETMSFRGDTSATITWLLGNLPAEED
jgi:hypothetical protein